MAVRLGAIAAGIQRLGAAAARAREAVEALAQRSGEVQNKESSHFVSQISSTEALAGQDKARENNINIEDAIRAISRADHHKISQTSIKTERYRKNKHMHRIRHIHQALGVSLAQASPVVPAQGQPQQCRFLVIVASNT